MPRQTNKYLFSKINRDFISRKVEVIIMERKYSTQMEAARMGIVTPELEAVAKKENRSVEELLPLMASGKMVIPANVNHKSLDPNGVGSMLKTK